MTAHIGSFEDVYAGMFGPLDHDAHVAARRRHRYLANQRERLDAADARAKEAQQEIIQRYRREREARI